MAAKPAMCDCEECVNGRTAHKARLRAATCKCGHVGAECFNDDYCTPDPSANASTSGHFEDDIYHSDVPEPCADDSRVQYWRKAYIRTRLDKVKLQTSVSSLENTCEHWEKTCDALQREHEERITKLEDELNWRDMEQETDDATIQQQTARITDLETTIRVLAGLLNG